MNLHDLLDADALDAAMLAGYVKGTKHPTEPLVILNYTAKCQYEQAWNPVTRACRGLIYNLDTGLVVARPWPKFHNYGEHVRAAEQLNGIERAAGKPETVLLDMDAPVRVFDKVDGSLGILYPTADGWAIATRGSFTSEQALRATEMLSRYGAWDINPDLTYLFEIIYPENRIVVDYGDSEDLVLLDILETETGAPAVDYEWSHTPMSWVSEFSARTLADALRIPPRANAEGLVVVFQGTWLRVKIKQDDYVALHRILTGLNARNVWEVAAVQACKTLVTDPKHWGSFLGIDPARAAEILTIEGDWLNDVPEEFYAWVRGVQTEAAEAVGVTIREALRLSRVAMAFPPGQERYEAVKQHPAAAAILKLAADALDIDAYNRIVLRAWREACPAPTAPFARSEDVA